MAGTTVIWWKNAPVEVNEVEANKRIVFHWDGGIGEDGGTLVIIEEAAGARTRPAVAAPI